MAATKNMQGCTPGAPEVPMFTPGSDGTADFGIRYSPLTGTSSASHDLVPDAHSTLEMN